jgi:ribonuclease HI
VSLSLQAAEIYTDGSCHTQRRTGGWAALVFTGSEKIIISGVATDTTHNRMEITAVIEGIEYVRKHYKEVALIHIFSDSQYVTGLAGRKEELLARQLITQNGSLLPNADLVRELWKYDHVFKLEFVKVKAHQPKNDELNHNIEVDKLARKMVRDAVRSGNIL